MLIMSVVLVACQSGRQEDFYGLRDVQTVSLKSKSMGLADSLLAPRKVFVLGSDLAVFEDKDKDGFLHFFTTDGAHIKNIGRLGNAPDEYISPNVFKNGDYLLVVSMNGEYSSIQIDGEKIQLSSVRSIENKGISMGMNFFAKTADGIVLEGTSTEDMLTFISDKDEKTVVNPFPIDNIPNEIDPFYKKSIIAPCSYAISYSLDTLFMSFKYYPVNCVVSISDKKVLFNKMRDAESGNIFRIKNGVPYYDNPNVFYTYSASSKNYFYALFQNADRDHMRKSGCSEIHVFRKDGAFLKRYILDRRIYHFDVNKEGTAIYALGINEELLSEIYVYSI